jgi:hypothetical protein
MSLGLSLGSFRPRDGVERIAEASHHLRDALRDASVDISRRANASADYARALGDDMLTSSRDAARTARAAIEERPVEALIVVGLAAFAIGWVMRRLQERKQDADAAPAPRRTTRARPRRRTAG